MYENSQVVMFFTSWLKVEFTSFNSSFSQVTTLYFVVV